MTSTNGIQYTHRPRSLKLLVELKATRLTFKITTRSGTIQGNIDLKQSQYFFKEFPCYDPHLCQRKLMRSNLPIKNVKVLKDF